MKKKDSIHLLSKVIDVVQELEQYRLWIERKSEKSYRIPRSTIERVLFRARMLYQDMSRYFIHGKQMPRESVPERMLRQADAKIASVIRENWRLEERLEKLQAQFPKFQTPQTQKKSSLSASGEESGMKDCA